MYAVPDTKEAGYQSTLSVTQDASFLVAQTAYNETTGNVYFQQNYWNFKTNVAQNVFSIPSECTTSHNEIVIVEENEEKVEVVQFIT